MSYAFITLLTKTKPSVKKWNKKNLRKILTKQITRKMKNLRYDNSGNGDGQNDENINQTKDDGDDNINRANLGKSSLIRLLSRHSTHEADSVEEAAY